MPSAGLDVCDWGAFEILKILIALFAKPPCGKALLLMLMTVWGTIFKVVALQLCMVLQLCMPASLLSVLSHALQAQ
jgi:hypothetical protein